MPPDDESAAPRSGRRPALGYLSLAAALVVGLAYLYFGREMGLPDHVLRDYRAFQQGTLDLQMLTSRHETLEAFFEHRGVHFPTRVRDLTSMDFALVGGRVHELDGKPSVLVVYRDGQGTHVICQTFEGRDGDLPTGRTVLEHAGTRFQIHRRGKVTLIFWQDGPVHHALASEVDSERLIELAKGDRSIFEK